MEINHSGSDFQKKKGNILILSYFFPPCNKVGGRRWAKFGKYLTQRNYSVFVVCVDVPFKGSCPWASDVSSYEKNITRLPYIEHRPFYKLNMAPKSFPGKIRYRLSRTFDRLAGLSSPGNRDDVSRMYGSQLKKKAAQIIRKNDIQTVIITGGPFHWCYEGFQLKEEFPGLKFILDLRDFWTGGELDSNLTIQQRNEESRKERSCIDAAAVVFTPAERIAEYLKNKYSFAEHKIQLLTHGFDHMEIPAERFDTQGNGIITMAYGGILYQHMDTAMDQFIDLLCDLKRKGRSARVDLYTFSSDYKAKLKSSEVGDWINYHETIPPRQLFEKFGGVDYLLQFRAGNSQEQHFKSTKFYELLALRRPIIYFGPEGDVSEFLEKNQLGFSASRRKKELGTAIISNKLHPQVPAQAVDVDAYSFESLTTQLEAHL